MIVPPLANMKLKTSVLPNAFGASFGKVRKWNAAQHQYTKNHQGWDLEAPLGTPCFAISEGLITHVGEHHPQFGRNIVLQFSTTPSARPFMSNTGDLFAFYAHLSVVLVSQGQPVRAGKSI